MPRDFNEFDFDGVNRSNNMNGKNFNHQELKQKLSGTFSFEELTGDANTRPNTPEKKKNVSRNRSKKNVSSVSEKPSALINTNKAVEQGKKSKGFFRSVWDMFHNSDHEERKMTVSSRSTVEEIKEQLEKLYDRIREYEDKLESKSKEISSKLVDLSKKTSKLNREINRSQSRINIFKKQIKGYEADLEKIKDKDDFIKQSIIDGKIKQLSFKVQEEQKKIEDAKSRLKPLSEQKEALQKKSKEIEESTTNLKKRSVAIKQKLGYSTVSKESTFEILRRSIREKYKYRSVYVDPAQVSNGNRAFRTTWNSKTYNFGNPEALKDLSIKGLTFRGLNLEEPRNWLEWRLKRAEQNGFPTTQSDERENNKQHGGRDNPEDR